MLYTDINMPHNENRMSELRTQNSESFIRLFNKYIYSLIILYR